MLLSDEERKKFIQYLENGIRSDEEIIEQMKKSRIIPDAVIRFMEIENNAAKIIHSKLLKTELA